MYIYTCVCLFVVFFHILFWPHRPLTSNPSFASAPKHDEAAAQMAISWSGVAVVMAVVVVVVVVVAAVAVAVVVDVADAVAVAFVAMALISLSAVADFYVAATFADVAIAKAVLFHAATIAVPFFSGCCCCHWHWH